MIVVGMLLLDLDLVTPVYLLMHLLPFLASLEPLYSVTSERSEYL